MPETKCGFNDGAGLTGSILLVGIGPTLLVDIGFDAAFRVQTPPMTPVPNIRGVAALVDTGATESCIDDSLAQQLNLPVIDRRPIAGISGKKEATMYLAQIRVPALAYNIYGVFAGVDLAAGGQHHRALIGRTFLQACTMIYDGKTGDVTIRV